MQDFLLVYDGFAVVVKVSGEIPFLSLRLTMEDHR